MRRREQLLFLEKQGLARWHARVILAFPPGALVLIACRQVLWHKPWHSPPVSNGDLLFLTILLAAVYIRLATVRLVTEVHSGEIATGLRGLWKQRRISLDHVRSAEVVTYNAAADFGGYGLRSGRRGTAYIARGDRAVELTLTNGERVLVGSQRAEELVQRVREARRQVKI